MDKWFSALFGVRENPSEVKGLFKVIREKDRTILLSPNGRKFQTGRFYTPKLLELEGTKLEQLKGKLSLSFAFGDVSLLIADPENRLSTFQVASQFNCLEFPSPNTTPEDGVTGYVFDRTQGPACSIACGPATVYRNYFVQMGDQEGQTADRQLNCLDEFNTEIRNSKGDFFYVRNGYTLIRSPDSLRQFPYKYGSDELMSAAKSIKVGVHADTQVTSSKWGTKILDNPEHLVTQVFGAACSIGYNHGASTRDWEPIARTILDASYEATFHAAARTALRHDQQEASTRLFLTLLGGGVFGNPIEWIADSIDKACEKFQDTNLQVFIVLYSSDGIPHAIESLKKKWGSPPK